MTFDAVVIASILLVTTLASLISAVRSWIGTRRLKREIETIRRSEARYRALIEHAADAILVADPNGPLIDANPSALALLGYTKDEILSLRMVDIIPPEDITANPIRIGDLKSGQVVRNERRLLRKDRTVVPIEVSARMLPDGFIQANVRDITERKSAEDAIRRNAELLREAQRLSHTGSWEWDLASNSLTPSEELYRVYGIESGEPTAQSLDLFTRFFHPDDLEQISLAMAQVVESERPVDMEFRIVRPDGEVRFLYGHGVAQRDEHGKPVRVIGASIDITERKLAEDAVRLLNQTLEKRVAERTKQLEAEIAERERTQAVLDAIMEYSPAAIFVKSATDFTYQMTSRASKTLYGLDLVGMTDFDHFPVEIAGPVRVADQEIATSGAVRVGEQRFRSFSGQLVDFLIVKFPLRDKAGAIFGIGGVAMDITERKRSEEELRVVNAALEQRVNERTTQLKLALAAGKLGTWVWSIPTNEVTWSDGVGEIFGLPTGAFAGTYQAYLDLIDPNDRAAVAQAVQSALEHGEHYQIEHRIVLPDGSLRWLGCEGEAFHRDGQPIRMAGTVQDITHRKQAEDAIQRSLSEKEVLLREIHHRVKNNLQIISGLLQFQSRQVRDPADLAAFSDGRNRIAAMTLVHEKLYQSHDLARVELGEYVRSLVKTLQQSYQAGAHQVRFRIDADPVHLPIELALPSGMVVCELVTNVFKYAFPNGQGGEASVLIRDRGGLISLTVTDTGVGLPSGFDPSTVTTFGWQLLQNLILQLDATLTFASGQGTSVTVAFSAPATHQASLVGIASR